MSSTKYFAQDPIEQKSCQQEDFLQHQNFLQQQINKTTSSLNTAASSNLRVILGGDCCLSTRRSATHERTQCNLMKKIDQIRNIPVLQSDMGWCETTRKTHLENENSTSAYSEHQENWNKNQCKCKKYEIKLSVPWVKFLSAVWKNDEKPFGNAPIFKKRESELKWKRPDGKTNKWQSRPLQRSLAKLMQSL